MFNYSCPAGYTGNALTSCVRGECMSNEECATHRRFIVNNLLEKI